MAAGVRKAGTMRGQPHYSAECPRCHAVLAAGHVSKQEAERRVKSHMSNVHGKR